MSRFKRLARAVASVLRGFRGRFLPVQTLPAYMTPIGRFLEPLEGRQHCDTPISPGLSFADFATPSLLFGTPAIIGQISSAALDQPQTFSDNPVTGAQSPFPFEVAYTGTISIAPDQAGTYHFQLPQAEGAILTIDGQTIIFAPSIIGDANLNGAVDFGDLNTIFSNYGDTGVNWTSGDFNGNGQVDVADLNDVLSNLGDSATPVIINNNGADNPYGLAPGIYLPAGNHNIELNYFQYNSNSGGQTPEALLQWMTSATGTYSGMSGLTLSPYETPVITAVSATGNAGAALDQKVANFSASAPGTSASDYTAVINWSGSQNETAQVVADGNGFDVVSHRQLPAIAGPLTGTLTVTHIPSGFSSSATVSVGINRAPLVSKITVNPSSAIVGSAATLSATVTPAANGDTLNYSWLVTNPASPSSPTTYTTSQPSLSFTPSASGNWSASLTATDQTLGAVAAAISSSFTVSEPAPLQISGPSVATVGQPVIFSVTGSAATDVSWTASLGGTVESSGTGTTIDFTPSASGSYVIEVNGSDSQTASSNLSVTALGPSVTISGQAVGFVGKPLAFAAQVSQGNAATDSLDYSWSLLNSDGSTYTGSLGGAVTTEATFVAPSTLPEGSYQASVTVSDADDSSVAPSTQTFSFNVLADPNSSNLQWGTLPTNGDEESALSSTDAMLQLPDGRIVMATNTGGDDPDSYADVAYAPAFLEMLNPDLTPDISFGTAGTGIEPIDFGSSLTTIGGYSTLAEQHTDIFAMAYDPSSGDIVVTGDVWAHGFNPVPQLMVAKIVTSNTVINGVMVPAGGLDPNFNGGQPKIFQDDTTEAMGQALDVLSDGSILVGGEAVTYSSTEISNGQAPQGDFFLMKLTSDGALDNTFGALVSGGSTHTGIAAQSNVSGVSSAPQPFSGTGLPDTEWIPEYGDGTSVIYAANWGVNQITVADGDIIIGGTVGRVNSSGSYDTGFGLVRYNSSGDLDSTFGDDGVVFSGSEIFGIADHLSGVDDGTAMLSAFNVLSDGSIRVAGVARPASGWYGLDDDTAGKVVLAQYTSDGSLDSSYGTDGVDVTSYLQYEPTLLSSQLFLPVHDGDFVEDASGARPENGAMEFESDGSLLVPLWSQQLDPTLNLVRIDTDDGSITDSTGTGETAIPSGDAEIPNPTSATSENWQFEPGERIGTILDTGNGILVGGLLHNVSDDGAVSNDVNNDEMDLPLLLRYGATPAPVASGLVADATSSTAVTITWQNSGYGEEGYQIERSTSPTGLSSSVIATVGSDQHDFTDSNLSAGTTYYYEVVPFYTDTSGDSELGTATAVASASTLPSSPGILKETVAVPVDGSTVTTSTVLETGVTYVLMAQGSVHLANEYPASIPADSTQLSSDYTADAGYWYSNADPSVDGQTFGGVQYGIGINQAFADPGENVVPSWGLPQPSTHAYSYAIVGTGNALTFQFHTASGSTDFIGPNDTPLTVQVYAVTSGTPAPAISASSGDTYKGTVEVPLNGSAATSSTELYTGHQYLLVAQGLETLSPDYGEGGIFGIYGDAAYWNKQVYPASGDGMEGAAYGVGANEATPTPDTVTVTGATTVGETVTYSSETATRNGTGWTATDATITSNNDGTFNVVSSIGDGGSAVYSWSGGMWTFVSGDSQVKLCSPKVVVPTNEVPNWGQDEATSHTYMEVVSGDDSALSFQLHSAGAYLPATVASGQQQLQVQIYELGAPTSTTLSDDAPSMRIASPAAASAQSPTAISTNTPVDIISTKPDGSAAPWALYLVSSSGQWNLLSSGDNSVGGMPDSSQAVGTIVPALYANGTYTLALTTTTTDPQDHVADSRQVVIATPVKVGNLSLPVTDAVLNTAAGQVTISRTYDSSNAGINDGFGPGWSLDLTDAHLTTTAQGDIYYPSQTSPALRAGDLVSLTVPDGGQHVFEFAPIPITDVSGYQGSQTSTEYYARFVAIDGSGATLTITGGEDNNSLSGSLSNYALAYDKTTNEFVWVDPQFGVVDQNGGRAVDTGFDLAPPLDFVGAERFWRYALTNSDGSSYLIDPRTGDITAATNSDGQTTNYSTGTDGSITAQANNSTIFTINKNSSGQITSISLPEAEDQPSINYSYDDNGNLIAVTNQQGETTQYDYQTSSVAGQPPVLSAVIDPQGKTVLQAQYDPATGQLQSLINSDGVTVPVSVAALGNNEVSQTVADAAGDITEDVFNEQNGTLDRKIQEQTDSAGNVLDYVVTVSRFTYVTDEVAEMSSLYPSGERMLQSVETFAPFSVSGPDAAGLRYTEQPDADSWTKRVTFDTSDDPNDAAAGQIISLSQRLDSAGDLQTTTYGDYALITSHPTIPQTVDGVSATVSPTINVAKPQMTTVTIQDADSGAAGGYDDHTKSQTYTIYNSDGNVQYSLTIVGPVPNPTGDPTLVGEYYAQGTENQYESGIAPSLVSETDNITATLIPDSARPSGYDVETQSSAVKSQNYYYQDGAAYGGPAGSSYGQVEYSMDAAHQETFYAYNLAGYPVLDYVYKTWTDPSGGLVNGWVGATSIYNALGELTDTYSATYLDTAGLTNGPYHTLAVTADGDGNVVVDGSEGVYGAPVRTVHNDYNSVGQKIDSIDQYGGETYFTYDSNGNVIRTINPNGTETRSVYDALNRVIWQTNTFVPVNGDPTSSDNTAVATHTIYDQLGNKIESDVYSGVAIEITSASLGSVSASTSTALVGGISDPQDWPGSDLVSTSKTYYDPVGNAIETISPSGLRTGTIYYPDGTVEYTGPLTSGAPDGGHEVTENGVTTYAYSPSDFGYYTQTLNSQYDSSLGLFYTRVIDANGHHTDTYTDTQGRTVRTVYDDGSFTETLYSFGTTPVSTDAEGESIPTPTSPEGWNNIPDGGSEVVQIAERKTGDAPVITYDLYDADGRLTDVWQPAVMDADPNSPTYSYNPDDTAHYLVPVRPHTSYQYDSAGNEITQITADEQADLTAWENAGHPASTFTGDTRYGYDQYGNQVSQGLPDGEVSTAQFNVFGQETLSTDPDGQTTAYVYNNTPSGQGTLAAKYYFAEGVAATDDGGNIRTSDAAEASTYAYDALGNLTTVKQYVAGTFTSTTTTTYDPILQLPTSITSPEGTIHYIYDDATGNLVETWTGTTQSSAQNDIQYGYDNQGRLTTVTQVRVNGSAAPMDGSTLPTTTYTYDNVGNLVGQSQTNSLTASYTYDDLNRLVYDETDFDNDSYAGGIIFTQSFDLNDDGTRRDSSELELDGHGGDVFSDNYNWTYDADGRLTGESETGLSSGDYADTFAYDLEGNRTQEQIEGGDSESGGSTVNYTYNGDNQLQTQTEHTNGETDPVYQTTSYYDAAGNLTSQATTGTGAQSTTYTYDERNNMTAAASLVGDVTTTTDYAYDDNGVLVSETPSTGSGQATYYLIDPHNPTGYAKAIQESSALGGAPAGSYVFGTDVIAQTDATNGTLYLIHDGHGSTRGLINSSGTLVQSYAYDAWGDALGFNPATALTPYLFGGDGTYDPASGFVYQLARWREGLYFTQRDSYQGNNQDPLSLHKYLYADANPITNVDPTGHLGLDIIAGEGSDLESDAEDALAGEGAMGEALGVVAEAETEQVGELVQEAITVAEQQATAGSSFGVIGSYPGYIKLAQALGAVYFNLSDALYAAGGVAANQAFIRAAIAAGVTFVLSTPPEEAGAGLQMEIQMLVAAGYVYVQTGLGITLAPPGGG